MLTEVRNAVVVGPTDRLRQRRDRRRSRCSPTAAPARASARRAARSSSAASTAARRRSTAAATSTPSGSRSTTRATRTARSSRSPTSRDRFTAPVRAVVDYSFGNYKFLALNDPPLADGKLKPEAHASRRPRRARDRRLQRREPRRLDPRRATTASPTRSSATCARPTSSASRRSRTTTAPPARRRRPRTSRSRALLAAIKAAGGPRYDYRQIDPASNQDGGEPDGNIRVGVPVPHRLAACPSSTGRAATRRRRPSRCAGAGGAQLTSARGASIPTNPALEQQPQAARGRVPLPRQAAVRGRQPLQLQGRRRADVRPLPGAARGSSEVQRHQPGATVAQRLRRQHPATSTRAREVVVLGDMNDFDFSRRCAIGSSDGLELVNLWTLLPAATSATPTSSRATARSWTTSSSARRCCCTAGRTYDAVHMNAEFTDQASDHDPPITRLDCSELSRAAARAR